MSAHRPRRPTPLRFPAVLVALLATLLLAGAGPGKVAAQDTPGEDRPRVFLDCGLCDFDYIRRTVAFVDWVRDREDAQLHVLVTTRRAGRGAELTLNLVGRGSHEGRADTLRILVDQDDTTQETREALTRALELRVAGFFAGTASARGLRVVDTGAGVGEGGQDPAEAEDDPWKAWVFSVGVDAFFSGQEAFSSAAVSTALGARHTSETWKVRFSATANYARDRFELSEDEDFTSIARTFRVTNLVVRSVSDHWSAGLRTTGNTSTFSNIDRTLTLQPAVEFSVFPYAESSTRDFRVTYAVGASALDYEKVTIFGKTEETLFDQSLAVALDLIQPWGSAQLAVEASSLLDDLAQNRVSLSGSLDWRIVRGLSFLILGDVARIADQRSIPAEGISDEDILLRRRELLTSFDFSLSLGLSYSFGSRVLNVVNPRFN